MKFNIEHAQGGSLPTIVDAETTISILAIDDRQAGSKRYKTPVFATEEVAKRVLAALNGEIQG